MMGRPRNKLIGQRFGHLFVLSFSHIDIKAYWNIRCDCGNEKIIRGDVLKNGATSCGCMRIDAAQTHGEGRGGRKHLKGTSEYSTWISMIQRCENPKAKGYNRYGGRGIKVCDRWRNSYEAFLADMGRKPTSEHSIDRINNNGNYEPSNCQWATREIQNANRSIGGWSINS